ncbi:MAG: methyltransferase domain-containing protein [Deltaproteobacteria bacterium]|nr:methyltransferase domain-containing protein [Deltaproteobacteria bacterium]TLN05219.1 MAG: methyltransferase domain-containing protein [bacterium]
MEKEIRSATDLLTLSNGYWHTCALHAGVKLDLFTALSACPFTAEKLAELVDCDERGLGMLLHALTAMGLLERIDDSYTVAAISAEFLSKTSPRYLGHIILHHHYLMSSWSHLDESVRSGGPVRELYQSGDESAMRESFEMGMFDLAMQMAPRIVPQIDLGGRRRLLDLGGGPGTYAMHFCQHNPGLSAVVFDLPSTRPFAEQTIARFNLSGRIDFVQGDFLAEPLQGPYDVAWLSHILHGQSPEECAVVVERAKEALEPGGMILIQEFILEDSLDGPVFPALFSLNMLLGTKGGQSYSWGQLEALLSDAGFRNLHRLPLQLPNGAGVIAAIRP